LFLCVGGGVERECKFFRPGGERKRAKRKRKKERKKDENSPEPHILPLLPLLLLLLLFHQTAPRAASPRRRISPFGAAPPREEGGPLRAAGWRGRRAGPKVRKCFFLKKVERGKREQERKGRRSIRINQSALLYLQGRHRRGVHSRAWRVRGRGLRWCSSRRLSASGELWAASSAA
jgi:hypothetical protein